VYKKGAEEPILAAIDMRGVDSCVVEDEESCKFILNLGGVVPQKYRLRATNSNDLIMWVEAINKRLIKYRQEEFQKKFNGPGGAAYRHDISMSSMSDSMKHALDDSNENSREGHETDDSTVDGGDRKRGSTLGPTTFDVTNIEEDNKPHASGALQVNFVGSFLDSTKHKNHTHPAEPNEQLNQLGGMLPLLDKNLEGMDQDNGTSAVRCENVFDGSFEIYIDGAETRKERNKKYTMYTIRSHAVSNNKEETLRNNMLIEEPIDIVVMRRYSDFRKMNDIVKSYLPLIATKLPVFPEKSWGLSGLVGGASHAEEVVQKRVEAFQLWLRALVKCKEAWQLRELLEFLDDSSSVSSRLSW
jgi:hypothetical protein